MKILNTVISLPGSEEESYTVGYTLNYTDPYFTSPATAHSSDSTSDEYYYYYYYGYGYYTSSNYLPEHFENEYCSRDGACDFTSYVNAQYWHNDNQIGIRGKAHSEKLNISQNSYMDINGEEIVVELDICNIDNSSNIMFII